MSVILVTGASTVDRAMLVATKAFIEQALQTIALKALNVAAKAALALLQNLRCLGLAEATLVPAVICF